MECLDKHDCHMPGETRRQGNNKNLDLEKHEMIALKERRSREERH